MDGDAGTANPQNFAGTEVEKPKPLAPEEDAHFLALVVAWQARQLPYERALEFSGLTALEFRDAFAAVIGAVHGRYGSPRSR